MSIRQRITLLVVLTFLIISAIGGYAIFQSHNSATALKSVTEGVVPSALASADLVSQLKDVQLAVITMVYAPAGNMATQAQENLSAKEAVLQKAIDLQGKGATSTAQRGLVDEAQESLTNYLGAINETVASKIAGKEEVMHASFFGNVVQYQTELEGVVTALRIEKNRSKDSAIESLNQTLATTAKMISIVTVGAVLFLTAIGVLLYRAISGPISRMQTEMTEIASSQDFTRRVPVTRDDEIGRSIVAFNGMIEKIEESSAQLKQKTIDIQTMLQNIPQGILTVVDGNRIHPEYSAFLETVFETKDIVGRNLMDLVFSNTNLGADSLSQVEAATSACVGEDVMNFEFNEHLMVGEIEKTMPDGSTKILDLSWSPITDDTGTIVRLMLCVRDVTELRKLAAEANEQKRELEIIGEILGVNQEKFYEFMTGSIKFVEENEAVIDGHPERNELAIAKLFRNMHTIKGNARTYGLLHLANIVHEAEQTYEELRKPDTAMDWDQTTLRIELALVRKQLDHYFKINEVTLGRKGPGRRGSVERYLMVDKLHIQESLHRLENVNTANLHELIAARDLIRRTLRLLGTEPIEMILSSVTDSLPTLAVELGKAPPLVTIENHGYAVHNQFSGLIKNVFMHLIRNALDHGIETPAVRVEAGKPVIGKINVAAGSANGMFQITLRDDGAGLALQRIRRKAIEKGLMSAEDHLSDEDVARLVFHPGFSTAEQITNVSGRGVGMDAVQDFVTREHGKVEIHFTDTAVGADFRQFEVRVCLPETVAVYIDGGDSASLVGSQHQTTQSGPVQHSGSDLTAHGEKNSEAA